MQKKLIQLYFLLFLTPFVFFPKIALAAESMFVSYPASVEEEMDKGLTAEQLARFNEARLETTYGNIYAAIAIYKPMADQGLAQAQEYVGSLYATKGNYTLANHYLKLSAEQGYFLGEIGYGQSFELGRGVEENAETALKWYKKALGNPKTEMVAQAMIGNMYFIGSIGKGEEKQKIGFDYIKKSAEGGYALGQKILGQIYAQQPRPSFLPQNILLNYKWTTIAEISGLDAARDKNIFMSMYSTVKEYAPYCFTLGNSEVASAFEKGEAALPKSNDMAMLWLKKGLEDDGKVSTVNFHAALLSDKMGESEVSYHYALAAINEPFPPAFQLYAQEILKQPQVNGLQEEKAYAALMLAVELYQHPNNQYFLNTETYVSYCRPDYKWTDAHFNLEKAQVLLEKIKKKLTAQQIAKAEQMQEGMEVWEKREYAKNKVY